MKSKCTFYSMILFSGLLLLAACSASSADWNSHFVVWKGDQYEVVDEYVTDVGEEVGEVTAFSDREGKYQGNFSNKYRKGTKYYAIPGLVSEEVIAVEEDGKYRKAVNAGKYVGK
ncbi:hypothetical protein [Sporosarcina gallistercoris]|uniref:Lipoprotein n=1 Tax=Sporosarcina gallistercoris TaxID=2762245 RepID=A0ABR8PIW7_9BACL|nr:hypothetical protein [Sporosarcina gallistercoris]MBD7908123.1 hypothetical protein [Sporosarcina gallistercoris]